MTRVQERIHKYSTPQYRAQEMCDLYTGEPLDQRVDIWAVGVTLYKLLFLRDLLPPGEEKLGILNFDRATRLSDQAAVTVV